MDNTAPPVKSKKNPRSGKPPAFQFYAADFLCDESVALMSTTQVGAYVLLLMFHWREGSIPADTATLARLCRMRSGVAWTQCWAGLERCFQPHPGLPGRLVQPRMFRDLQEAHDRRTSLVESGQRGGRKSAQLRRDFQGCLKPPSTSASASASAGGEGRRARDVQPPEENTHTGHLTLTPGRSGHRPAYSRPARVPGGFEEFWRVWPRKTAKEAARRAFMRLDPDRALLDRLVASVERWRASEQWTRGVIPHPATWINGRRWEDEMMATQSRLSGIDEWYESRRNGGRHD